MRVRPENLAQRWRETKEEILDRHPELVGIRAGDLAAAQLFNWFHEDWGALKRGLEDSFLSGELARDDERLRLYSALLDWSPSHTLRELSLTRTLLRDLDHPIVVERSTPPAEILGIQNYWKTERIEGELETFADIKRAWGGIRAEFRPRVNGEGCVYTNHQGIHAIITAFEILDQTRYGESEGMSSGLAGARKTADYFRGQAEALGGRVGENFEMLADLFDEAIADAAAHKKGAIAIVDTTYPGVKGSTRHEAFHVWERTVNLSRPGLLGDRAIRSDPDYPMLERGFSKYYEQTTPGEITSEAVAFVASGDWELAGFESKERALKYLDRFFSNVVVRYGKRALEDLHLVHPNTRRIIEDVRNTPIRELRERRNRTLERAGGADIGSGSQSAEEAAGSDRGAAPGEGKLRASQSRLVGGRTGEDDGGLRGDRRDSGRSRYSDHSVSSVEIAAPPAPPLLTHADANRSTAELLSALRTIAQIESLDRSGALSWRDLVFRSAGIADEAIARTKAAELGTDREIVTALERISNIGALFGGQDRNDRQLSWKDLAGITVETARQALEKAEPVALTIQQASNAMERPGPRHDQGMEL